ncbi:MAG: hypothetical protein ACFHX7_20795 [Pseudomonadota bacterium]
MREIWRALASVDARLAVGVVAGFATVVAATVTVSLGKYFERKQGVESHFRDRKLEIYDEFLKELFRVFFESNPDADDPLGEQRSSELVDFLREWQRKMIVWGGSDVLLTFMKWKEHLAKGEPDAESVFLMGDFFLAVRRDLGLSNKGFDRTTFAGVILRSGSLLTTMAKENPQVTLAELGEIEKQLEKGGS